MGRKNVVKSFKMIDSGDLSGSLTSQIVNVINLDNATIHLVWSNAAALDGSLIVEARNGTEDSFYEVDMGSPITLSGASGDHELRFNVLPGTEIRLQYTPVAGSGELDAVISAKTTGA